jgi:AcrR family transcriptional regulator/DNA-binding MarR family transcriptional regulator
VEIQRVRMVTALLELTRERGVGGVTVAHIVGRSGVSRRTFYEVFDDIEDCFLVAFELALKRAAQCVLVAYESQEAWKERIRGALAALLEFLEEEPEMGSLLIVDVLGAGTRALGRRAQVLEHLIAALQQGERKPRDTVSSRLTAEGLVGAALAILHARLISEGGVFPGRRSTPCRSEATAPAMIGLLGPLMAMVVLPYEGQAVAARELARPTPPIRSRREARKPSDPLRALDMRVTYRTIRVLLAIAERPGANNRQVAEASGVQDQGQISKLLARLEHLELISNSSAGAIRGEPNSWSLTPKGHEVQRVLTRHESHADA